MAIDITCAGCQSVYPVADNLIGKTIRCKKCGEMMPVLAPVARAAPVAAKAAKAAKPAVRIADDDEDARPQRPAARRARDDDDEDRPAPKKKSALPMLLIGGVLLLVVLAGGGAAAVFGLGLLDGKDVATIPTKEPSPFVEPITTPPTPKTNDPVTPPTGTLPTSKGSTTPIVPKPLDPLKQPFQGTNLPTPGTPRETLDRNTLNKCKNATVYFEVESKTGRRATGSGWFGLEPNLIFTNAHVVAMKSSNAPKPAKLVAYVNAGTPQQRMIPHNRLEILAVDPVADIALIRVLNEKDLPTPLQIRPSADLPELEKAVILGFPGGAQLARITGSDAQPAVTVNPSSVGAVRRDSLGNLSGVQFRGGSAPGGSGGPIVDMDGNVIAVLFMGPTDAVLASAACFGVPTEYVSGIVAGRVSEVAYGQPYRKSGKVHIPVTANCLDPFGRLKTVGIGCWVGDTSGKTRVPGTERSGIEPSDLEFHEATLAYKHTKDKSVATGELILPELPAGRSYWAQPFYSNALVAKQWMAGNAIKLSGPPVDHEPADLIVRYKPNTRRPITLSNVSALDEFEEGESSEKSERVLIDTTIKMSELVQRPSETGAVATLALSYEKIELKGSVGPIKLDDLIPREIRGLLQEGIKQVQGVGQVNREGEIYKTASNLRSTGQYAALFGSLSDEALESLKAASIRLPNSRVNPGHTWEDKKSYRLAVTIGDGAELLEPGPGGPGGRPAARPPAQRRARQYRFQQEVKYTFLGTRVRAGSKEAVIKIEGTITTPPGVEAGNGASGLVKGFAFVDLDTGMVIEAEVERELEIDTSSNGIKKRVSGINKYKLSRGAAVTGS